MHFRLATALLGIVIFASCSSEPEYSYDKGRILAEINGEPLYEEFFEETYVRFLMQTGQRDIPVQRWLHLQTLSDHMLMAQEAERRGLNDDKYTLFVEKQRSRSLRNAFVQREVIDRLPEITDEESRFAFYRSKQKAHVWQLYFPNEQMANQYHQRIQRGENFVDLANELYNIPQYDSLAGYIGEVTYFSLEDHYAEAVYGLQAGEISQPVQTRHGWYIVKVENWHLQHILTETEYQQSRRGIDFRAFQRKYNVEGDKFVQEYMSGKEVTPINENLAILQRVIRNTVREHNDPLMPAPQTVTEADQFLIEGQLDPMMPLATYIEDGERKAFRVKDYMYWVDFLPINEVVFRLGPSVGRALMWDVFARQSVIKGYDRDPFIDFNAHHAGIFFLAGRLQDSLATKPVPYIDEEDLRAGFEMFRLGTVAGSRANYWIKEVTDFRMGQQLKATFEEDPSRVAQTPGVQHFENIDFLREQPEYSNIINNALLGQVLVAGVRDSWYIFQVHDREVWHHSFESRRDEVFSKMQPLYNEYLLIKELRTKANISVDSAAVESTMQYYPNL